MAITIKKGESYCVGVQADFRSGVSKGGKPWAMVCIHAEGKKQGITIWLPEDAPMLEKGDFVTVADITGLTKGAKKDMNGNWTEDWKPEVVLTYTRKAASIEKEQRQTQFQDWRSADNEEDLPF